MKIEHKKFRFQGMRFTIITALLFTISLQFAWADESVDALWVDADNQNETILMVDVSDGSCTYNEEALKRNLINEAKEPVYNYGYFISALAYLSCKNYNRITELEGKIND